ncbi:hypothetical protein OIU84_005697 [Salix udensis]|uniref:Uncharacterized protein n=1 Tax=Salix udensis TaxID=889485 RepID=A0AAD6JWU3_9ROSI|nr:hypothetical protein OIU84_005697 [Salix udensis]
MLSANPSSNHSPCSVNIALIHELLVLTIKMSSFWRLSGGNTALTTNHAEDMNETDKYDEQGQTAKYDDHLTPEIEIATQEMPCPGRKFIFHWLRLLVPR